MHALITVANNNLLFKHIYTYAYNIIVVVLNHVKGLCIEGCFSRYNTCLNYEEYNIHIFVLEGNSGFQCTCTMYIQCTVYCIMSINRNVGLKNKQYLHWNEFTFFLQ
jgi:carbamoylphosphate synthase large subunit